MPVRYASDNGTILLHERVVKQLILIGGSEVAPKRVVMVPGRK
jgi:hypothetical protein